jgi:DNA-binding transcriptional regulator YiaG
MPATLTDVLPVTVRLNDGRTLFVELPATMVRTDRDGSLGYTIEGMRLIDRLRALATRMGDRPTPGHILALREALGLTQQELGQRVGVDKLTVSRWERGQVHPSAGSVRRLMAMRNAAARRGVVVEG